MIRTCLVLLAVLLVGCNSSAHEPLLGEYASKSGGPAAFRVNQEGSNVYVETRQGEQWTNRQQLSVCTEDETARIFGPEWRSLEPHGLKDKQGAFYIYKVKPGVKIGGREFRSGYYAVLSLLLQGDVYRK